VTSEKIVKIKRRLMSKGLKSKASNFISDALFERQPVKFPKGQVKCDHEGEM